jgi:hypothetical protein
MQQPNFLWFPFHQIDFIPSLVTIMSVFLHGCRSAAFLPRSPSAAGEWRQPQPLIPPRRNGASGSRQRRLTSGSHRAEEADVVHQQQPQEARRTAGAGRAQALLLLRVILVLVARSVTGALVRVVHHYLPPGGVLHQVVVREHPIRRRPLAVAAVIRLLLRERLLHRPRSRLLQVPGFRAAGSPGHDSGGGGVVLRPEAAAVGDVPDAVDQPCRVERHVQRVAVQHPAQQLRRRQRPLLRRRGVPTLPLHGQQQQRVVSDDEDAVRLRDGGGQRWPVPQERLRQVQRRHEVRQVRCHGRGRVRRQQALRRLPGVRVVSPSFFVMLGLGLRPPLSSY